MNIEQEVSFDIFDFMIPYSFMSAAPVAYIIVETGHECAVDEEKLQAEFKKIKWDTCLSTADLDIRRRPAGAESDCSLSITGYSCFEENGVPDVRKMKNGPISIGFFS